MLPIFILGSQSEIWLAAVFVELALDGMAHSDLPWTYGIFGRLFVSPSFHRVHHSTDQRHFGRNFGQQYSLWDRLFGTASDERPDASLTFGLINETLPSSFTAQQFAPVLRLLRRVRWTRTAIGAAQAATPPL
jgi:sterol desaturase/sphingolipid hydroxylase (fatty acid hydroxylase superfamily)